MGRCGWRRIRRASTRVLTLAVQRRPHPPAPSPKKRGSQALGLRSTFGYRLRHCYLLPL